MAHLVRDATRALVRAMERRGCVVRRQIPGNRRKVHVFLTARGRALQGTLVRLSREVNRRALAGGPRAERAVTRRTLLAVLENRARDDIG